VGCCTSAKPSLSHATTGSQRRSYYLQFGVPPPGINAGNTAASTHAVRQIIGGAINDKLNHDDGGWKKALQVGL